MNWGVQLIESYLVYKFNYLNWFYNLSVLPFFQGWGVDEGWDYKTDQESLLLNLNLSIVITVLLAYPDCIYHLQPIFKHLVLGIIKLSTPTSYLLRCWNNFM